ncbi:endonuclease III [Candidatus Bathyarchaeota archaeon]|nr:endonuclease III [Candidatus Bathyarchaeota archaeon]
MKDKERAKKILSKLGEEYEVNGTALNFNTPLDLLVATILSAQSTDEKINEITKDLFKKYNKAEDYVNASDEELKEDIKSSGFYNRKADWIKAATQKILEEYNGEVPDNMEDLVSLKGVARKTANIVLQNAFDKVVGIAVDTHVDRLSHRLGFTDEDNRDKIEMDLMEVFPKDDWMKINYLLIEHGRTICEAKKPLCSECAINDLCPSAFTFEHNKDKK